MLKQKPLNSTRPHELIILISASILIFLASSMLLMGFGVAVIGVLWKEKITKSIDKCFDEVFDF
jgi:hypothetical protein